MVYTYESITLCSHSTLTFHRMKSLKKRQVLNSLKGMPMMSNYSLFYAGGRGWQKEKRNLKF